MEEENVGDGKSNNKKSKISPKNQRIRCGLKAIIILFCVSGFTIQTLQLVLQYISGQTVVNIKVEKTKFDKIPAITICYPTFKSMKKIANIYPEVKILYEEYERIMKNVSEGDYSNKTLVNYLEDHYGDIFTETNKEFEIPIYDLFDNLSIPFKNPKRGKYISNATGYFYDENAIHDSPVIDIDAKGRSLKLGDSEEEDLNFDESPVESISIEDRKVGKKCFTFFSDLNQKWREFKMELDVIDIEIRHHNTWFPPNFYDNLLKDLLFSMHSPNSIPDLSDKDNYIQLKAGYNYEITYSRLDTILLPPNYKTNCRNYDLDDTKHEKLRTDCMSKCVNKNLQKTCTKCVFQTGSLLRKEVFSKFRADKFCPFTDDDILDFNFTGSYICFLINNRKFKSICEQKCPHECKKQFYNFEVKSVEKSIYDSWDKETRIQITHNRLPDQVIEHLPEMEFITFMGNFGGLLGVWMGLSALAVLDFILNYFS